MSTFRSGMTRFGAVALALLCVQLDYFARTGLAEHGHRSWNDCREPPVGGQRLHDRHRRRNDPGKPPGRSHRAQEGATHWLDDLWLDDLWLGFSVVRALPVC